MGAVIRIFEPGVDESQSVVFELSGDVVTIGRGMECHVRLATALASRKHCQIERHGDRYRLVDLESQNGTKVNGKEVNARDLEDGDRIEIGDVQIGFETEEQGAKPALKPLRRRRSHRLPRVRRPKIKSPGAEKDGGIEERFVSVLEEIGKQLGPEGLAEAEGIFQDYIERGEGGRFRKAIEEAARLSKVVEIAKAVGTERNLRRLFNLILDEAVLLTEAERGFLVIAEGGAMRIEAARNFDRESVRKPEDKISRSIAEQVARTGEDVLSADAQNDARFREYMSVSEMRLRSLLCVPLKLKKQVVGVLYLDNRFESGVFGEEDLRCLSAFADLAAIALDNARLNETAELRAADLAKEKERGERLNTLLSRKLEEQGIEVSALQAVLGDESPAPKYDYHAIIGRSPAMIEMFRLLDRVVESEAPVLIVGESGTGKELVAQAVHTNGRRKDKPFVSENCAAIPETLLESELFGYKKGAFTGAYGDKSGLFQQADGGTLFLDEIADMSPAMQKKLLRALQEGEIRMVGGNEAVKVNVRLVAASNKDLKRLLQEGLFREDLYYRINVLQVALPPLRDRREDIPLLVEHFLSALAPDSGKPPKVVSKEAMGLLMNYDWPGNVRELENEVRRAFTVSDAAIQASDLSPGIQDAAGKRSASAAPPLRDIVREAVEKVEREAILSALKDSGWKKSEAARLLGISRPTLDAKIAALNIQVRAPESEGGGAAKP